MPVSPEDTAAAARAVASVYRAAEQSILQVIARELRTGVGRSDWTERKLAATSRVRRHAERLLRRAEEDAAERTGRTVGKAARQAIVAAVRDMGGLVERSTGELRRDLDTDRLTQLALATVDTDQPPILSALRTVVDAFRRIVTDTTAAVLAGGTTRREAAQQALWKAARTGITRFVSNDGRRWELASWAEMSVRTTTTRVTLDAHNASLRDLGAEFVIVSDAPQECSLCRPWEGTVLTIGAGPTGTVQRNSVTGGPPVRFDVAGSLPQARAAGLFHPNCRHRTSAYLPGATTRPESTRDPDGGAAREHLRYLERQVREWKKRKAAAISPQAESEAEARVRAYQARIREHVATTSAKRQPAREQITRAR